MVFKKIASAAALAATLAGPLAAQTAPADSLPSAAPDKPRTLLHASKIKKVGIYVAPEAQFGQFSGEFAPIGSHSLMLLFNHRFALGVSGGMMAGRDFAPSGLDIGQQIEARAGFGGLKMEYAFAPMRAVHITVPVLIGAMQVRLDSLDNPVNDPLDEDFPFGHGGRHGRHGGGEAFAFVQPGLMLEANLTSFAKFYLGASYRATLNAPDTYAVGTNTVQFGNSQASGAVFSAGVKLGWFDIRKPKVGHHQRHKHSRD